MSKVKKISVKTNIEKTAWEAFIKTRREANFLHSWNWGDFHEKLGKRVYRIGIFENNLMVGCALVVKEEAKRGSYFAISGGPIVNWEKINEAKTLVSYIKRLATAESCVFIRLRPQILDSNETREVFRSLGFKLSPMHLTADLTLQVDLSQAEDELLKNMRKSTRYEIRKSQKLGIKLKKSQDANDIKNFHKYHIELAKKHDFVPFSFKFLYQQFKVFSKNDQALLFHAFKGNNLLASAFVIFYNKEAVYHYGISTEANSKLPGSYACQWEAILEAKKRGMERYNLWGVASKGEKSHRFSGVSLFKRGFGGSEVNYLPAHDLPLNWKYWFTYLFEMGRKRVRNQ